MKLWLDAHLPPSLAEWLNGNFDVEATAIRDLGLRDATDRAIHDAAREADAVVVTKDADFVQLLQRRGTPPRLIWLTCGNTSNARLRQLLSSTLPAALQMLATGESFVEIGNAPVIE